jgi:tRNA-Thr(GGU) m(6)t(6)A37 methyltransferase TsaA
MNSLTLTPIGYIRTPYTDRYRAPRQPGEAAVGAEGEIVLEPGHNFEQALIDLEGFERIWVLYWFDRNTTWKPKVLPPRGSRIRRGVFATRSPHRPNPIGLSLLRLIEVRGRIIRVADVDLLDGTPVLDIKPYLPYAEAFPDARAGWLDDVIASEAEGSFDIVWSPRAVEQFDWLAEEHGIMLADVAENVLRRDPTPHPYRRVSEREDGAMELAVKSWRIIFRVTGRTVVIERVESGYHPSVLLQPDVEVHERGAHEEFILRWGCTDL